MEIQRKIQRNKNGTYIYTSSGVHNKYITDENMNGSKLGKDTYQDNEYLYQSRLFSFDNCLEDLKNKHKNLKNEAELKQEILDQLDREKNKEKQSKRIKLEEQRLKIKREKEKKNKGDFGVDEGSQNNLNEEQINQNTENLDPLEKSFVRIKAEYEKLLLDDEAKRWELKNEIFNHNEEIKMLEILIQSKEREKYEIEQLRPDYYRRVPQSTDQQNDNKEAKQKYGEKKADEENQNNNQNQQDKTKNKKQSEKEKDNLIPFFLRSSGEKGGEETKNTGQDGSVQKEKYTDYIVALEKSTFDNKATGEQRQKEEEDTKSKQIKDFLSRLFIIFLSFVADMLMTMIIVYPIAIVFGLIQIVVFIIMFFKYSFIDINLMISFFLIIFNSSITVFIEVMFFCYISSDTIEKYMFLDAFIYLMTSLLVVSYIKCIHLDITQLNGLCSLDHYVGPRVKNVLFISYPINRFNDAHVFDGRSDSEVTKIQDEYKRIMDSYHASEDIKQSYKTLGSVSDNPFEFQCKGEKFIVEYFEEGFRPSLGQFFILVGIVFLKASLFILYILLHQQTLNIQTSLIILLAPFIFHMNMTWTLSKALSSQDLRRKMQMMDDLNAMVDIMKQNSLNMNRSHRGEYKKSEEQKKDELQKAKEAMKKKKDGLLDITCPISCETWDNTRQCIADFQQEKLQKMEYAYVCLFFYYIFVTFLCVVSIGQFYIIIPKESFLLHPLMTIQNTFDFLFLNALLLSRIYFGSEFNNKWDESQDKIDKLIGITEDLAQMFDFYFINQSKQTIEEQMLNDNAYYIIVERVQQVSESYYNTNKPFLGKVYPDKKQLQIDILKNMISSFQKIKKQIQIDRESKCYKFLTFIKLSFGGTIASISLAFISTFPTVISKFILIFENQHEKS